MQNKGLALQNQPISNVNIGRALACRCIRSDRKRPDQSENVGDGLIDSGTLHADKRASFGLIHAGKNGHIGHLYGSLYRQGGLLHDDTDADVLYRQLYSIGVLMVTS